MSRNEAARPGKRPLRTLTAQQKLQAIRRVHEGESKAAVARDIGVPESTLRGWCKSEHKLQSQVKNLSTFEQVVVSSPDCSENTRDSSQCTSNLSLTNTVCSTPKDTSMEEMETPNPKKPRLDNGHASSTSVPYNGDVNEPLTTPNQGPQYQLATSVAQPTHHPKVMAMAMANNLVKMQNGPILNRLFVPSNTTSSPILNLNREPRENGVQSRLLTKFSRLNGMLKRKHAAAQQERNLPKTSQIKVEPGTSETTDQPSTSSAPVNPVEIVNPVEPTQPNSTAATPTPPNPTPPNSTSKSSVKMESKKTVENVALILSLQNYIQNQQQLLQEHQRLLQQQQHQQQHNINDNSLMERYLNLYSQIKYAARLDNNLNNSNNNVQQNSTVDESRSMIENLSEAIYHVQWLLNWLSIQTSLTSRITFSQIQTIIKIQDCLKRWKSELENSSQSPQS